AQHHHARACIDAGGIFQHQPGNAAVAPDVDVAAAAVDVAIGDLHAGRLRAAAGDDDVAAVAGDVAAVDEDACVRGRVAQDVDVATIGAQSAGTDVDAEVVAQRGAAQGDATAVGGERDIRHIQARQ